MDSIVEAVHRIKHGAGCLAISDEVVAITVTLNSAGAAEALRMGLRMAAHDSSTASAHLGALADHELRIAGVRVTIDPPLPPGSMYFGGRLKDFLRSDADGPHDQRQ